MIMLCKLYKLIKACLKFNGTATYNGKQIISVDHSLNPMGEKLIIGTWEQEHVIRESISPDDFFEIFDAKNQLIDLEKYWK